MRAQLFKIDSTRYLIHLRISHLHATTTFDTGPGIRGPYHIHTPSNISLTVDIGNPRYTETFYTSQSWTLAGY
jgi:hypothetical protein